MRRNFPSTIFVIYSAVYLANCNKTVNIGVLFETGNIQPEIPISYVVYRNNYLEQNTKLNTTIRLIDGQENFQSAKTLCNLLEETENVAAILASNPKVSPTMQAICSKKQIPYVQTRWLPADYYLDNKISVNFYPEAELLAKGFGMLVRSLQWDKFAVLYQKPDALIRLKDVLKLDVGVVKKIDGNLDVTLKKIKQMRITNIVIDCEVGNVAGVLQQGKKLDMLQPHYSYFVTSLDSHSLDFVDSRLEANLTTVRLFDPKDETFADLVKLWEFHKRIEGLNPRFVEVQTVLMHDAMTSLAEALNALRPAEFTNIACFDSEQFKMGPAIISHMKSNPKNFSLSGPIKFDIFGRRTNFNLNLVQEYDNSVIATWNPLQKEVTFTRDFEELMKGLQRNHIRVVSRILEPYLMPKILEGTENSTDVGSLEGYCLDLINEIAQILNVTVDLYLAPDNTNGNYDPATDSWSGVTGEIVDNKADLAISDLTITPERETVVDFSLPFMRLGVSVVYKKIEEPPNIWKFLEPLTVELWLYMLVLGFAIAIVLYFVASKFKLTVAKIGRMAPGDWENPHPCNQKPETLINIWNLKNAFWLVLGSINNQGCDILPKGVSSRLVSSMWWFFALIITQSYIASLSAFLTNVKVLEFKQVRDLAKQNRVKYGVTTDGATHEFFMNTDDSAYKKMYESMLNTTPSVFEPTMDRAIKRIQINKEGEYAFLTESTTIEYATERNCDLKSVKEPVNLRTFGIAMPRNYPYRSKINDAILQLQEKGQLINLKNKWWKKMRKSVTCQDKEPGAALTLQQLGGAFVILSVGCTCAVLLGIMEFLATAWKTSVNTHTSFWKSLKLEIIFALKVWISEKKTKPKTTESTFAIADEITKDPSFESKWDSYKSKQKRLLTEM